MRPNRPPHAQPRKGRRRNRDAWSVAACLAILSSSTSPYAEEFTLLRDTPPEPAGATEMLEPSAEIYVIGGEAEFQSLRQVVGSERIARARASWFTQDRLVPEALLGGLQASSPTVRCWIDLSLRDRASLYFADRSSEHFLVRELRVSRTLSELEKEALAQIIETSVAALLADSSLGISRANVEALLKARTPGTSQARHSPPPLAAPPRTVTQEPIRGVSPRYGSFAGIGYLMESHSPQIPWVQGPAAVVGVARQGDLTRASLGLRVGYQLPESYRGDLAGVRLAAYRFRLIGSLEAALGSRDGAPRTGALTLGLSGTAGVNLISTSPLAGTADKATQLEPSQLVAGSVVGLAVRAGVEWGSFQVAFSAGTEVDLERLTYDVRLDGTRVHVVEPQVLHPGLLAELVWQ